MNFKKMIKAAVREELEELLPKLINQALMREVTMEDGHSEPGVVKSVVKNINAIDQLVFYLPYIEKSILGVQTDICETKNKVAYITNKANNVMDLIEESGINGFSITHKKPQIETKLVENR